MASLAPRTGLLGRRLAAHLLRRATYGPTRAEIEAFAAKTADQAVEDLLLLPPMPDHPVDPQTGQTWVISGRTGANASNRDLKLLIGSWWLHRIFDPSLAPSLEAKLHFFLHTCFVTNHDIIGWSENHYWTLRLFYHYLLGSYKELAFKMCLDNGMNDFLDIGDSREGNPNENYAREFMELFTIGKGLTAAPGDYSTFTEQDVYEAARLITGFRRNDDWDNPAFLDPDTGMPRAELDVSRHDPTDKLFSARFNNQIILGRATEQGMLDELQDFVDMVFAQEATARTLAKRLYRYFVRAQVSMEVEADIIAPLAQDLMANNYELRPVVARLLKSEHFYDEDDADAGDEVVGALIKSPLEVQAGMMRFFELPAPDPVADPYAAYVTFYRWGVQDLQEAACFDLFKPAETAGYPPVFQGPDYHRLWINAKSIPGRYKFADHHLYGPPEMQLDLMAYLTNPDRIPDFAGPDPMGNPGPHPGARIGDHLVQTLLADLLPEAVPQDRFAYFLDLLLDSLSLINWMFEWDHYLSTGDDTNVKPQVERLIRGILQSPEYQLA